MGYAILSAVLMGCTAIINKFALLTISPISATVINSLIASIFALIFVKSIKTIKRTILKPATLLVGIFNAFGLLLMFSGLSRLDPGIASILGTSYFIFAAVSAVYIFKEKLNAEAFLFIVSSIAGLVLIVYPSHGVSSLDLIGSMMVISAAFLFASSNSFAKLSGVQPDVLVFTNNFITFMIIGLLGMFTHGSKATSFNLIGILLLGSSAFIGSFLGLLFYYKSLRKIKFSLANMARTVSPLTALILSRIFFPSPISFRQWLGIVLVIFSVYRINVVVSNR